MSELLPIALVAAGILIGITGAWSPCGLSMVETIGPGGHTGGRRLTWLALTTFLPGCLIGGLVTFGGLAWIGSVLHGAGEAAYIAAAVIALAAALAEARGLPIRPQIRRQLPEPWRRALPMPMAAGLYGILLGLGFTTFVLSFGVWALAAISLLVADLREGLLIGAAFGVGRALPVLLLAPISERPVGIRATELMTQSPALYRGFRGGDAITLGLVAAALVGVGTAAVAERAPGDSYRGKGTPVVAGAGDPGWAGGDLVAQRARGATARTTAALGQGGGILIRQGDTYSLQGGIPAIGGSYIALRRGLELALLNRRTLVELARVPAPQTDAIAVSDDHLVERVHDRGRDRLQVRAINRPSGTEAQGADRAARVEIGEPRILARAAAPAQIGRPSLAGNNLLFTYSMTTAARLRHFSLRNGSSRTLLAGRRATFTNPTIHEGVFAYVRTTRERQEIRLRALGGNGPGRVIHHRPATSIRDGDRAPGRHRIPTRDQPPRLDRDPWTVWSLALAPRGVYATLTRPRAGTLQARILRFSR